MYEGKKILTLIPARGQSKGLPRKNIRHLGEKPLIAWTIEAAKKSIYIDRLIVSTDDKEIADCSVQYQADVPFMRPKELAEDDSKMKDVISHAIKWVEDNDSNIYDILILLQPTSPLRTSEDIDEGLRLLFSKGCKAVVSVCQSEHSVYWMNTIPSNGCMKDFLRPEIKNKNRQEFPIFYRLNGAIFLGDIEYVKKQGSFIGNDTFAYIMPKERSIDIDDEFDFKLAEYLLKNY